MFVPVSIMRWIRIICISVFLLGFILLILRDILTRVVISQFLVGTTTSHRQSVESNMINSHTSELLTAIQNKDLPQVSDTLQILSNQRILSKDQLRLNDNLKRFIAHPDDSQMQSKLTDILVRAQMRKTFRINPLFGGFYYRLSHLRLKHGAKYYNVGGLDLLCFNTEDRSDSIQVVLYFYGNGSYIEDVDWYTVNLYKSIGYGFCAFNYRGFGNSTKPNPSITAIAEDAEIVYLYIRDTLKIMNIGIHGLSMGGHPAVSVGSKYHKELKFVVADKTFRSSEAVAVEKLGGSKIGRWLMKWTGQSTGDKLELWRNIECKKILIYSEIDEMIVGDARLIDSTSTVNLFEIKQGKHSSNLNEADVQKFKDILSQ
jgi:alpha/beta hydrolase fold